MTEKITFASLGISQILCDTLDMMNWKEPSKIQQEVLPVALSGRDIIGLAETGSGKTGAFALPIVQALLEKQAALFALVITPTRELAVQISEQFQALGASINLKCAVILGGLNIKEQKVMLEKRPHIIIATPGRIVDHLKHTKGFNLKSIKYLVLDEADKLLNKDFEKEIDTILSVIPKERKTYLFSATMTKKVNKLQRASLEDPVQIEVSSNFQTSAKLKSRMLLVPYDQKMVYLTHLLNEIGEKTIIIFCNTCATVDETVITLRILGFMAIPLHGQLSSQNQRQGLLTRFRSKEISILVATDIAGRGLDISHVDVVINFCVPLHNKEFIHRVGRTARAGREGEAFTFVTQYDALVFTEIENQLGYKIDKHEIKKEEIAVLTDTVTQAKLMAIKEIEDNKRNRGRKRKNTIHGVPVQAHKKRKY